VEETIGTKDSKEPPVVDVPEHKSDNQDEPDVTGTTAAADTEKGDEKTRRGLLRRVSSKLKGIARTPSFGVTRTPSISSSFRNTFRLNGRMGSNLGSEASPPKPS